MDKVQGESRPTILWVRHCRDCGRIDGRNWFDVPEEASDRPWSCPACTGATYVLLKTKW
jgi:hypothetical protein